MKIDRRVFLSASLAALLCGEEGFAASKRQGLGQTGGATSGGTTQKFFGNPNSTISSIDTSGGIACSKVTGQTPCFVQVSASAIKCSGSRPLTQGSLPAVPYEDLEFTWDFGEPQGVEFFTRPTDGATINANNQQGPEAAYCYRKPGTYVITLTIRGNAGAGGYVTASATKSITVSAFTASAGSEYWVDSVYGSDFNGGTSPASPKKTLSFLQSGSGGTIPNWPGTSTTSGSIAIHLAQQSRWTMPNGIKVPNANAFNGPASNLRIDSYVGAGGPGAMPIIEVTGATAAFDAGNPGPPKNKSNFVISGIKFTNSAGASGQNLAVVNFGNVGYGPLRMTDIYFDRCTIDNTLNIPSFMNAIFIGSGDAGSVFTNMGFWGCAITGAIFDQNPQTRHAIFGGPTSWWFVVGCTISGSGANAILDHHIYPETQYNSLYKWITFGATGITATSQRNYCINTNVEGGALTIASYFLLSENRFFGTKLVADLDNVNNDPTRVQFINFVVEKNAVANVADVSTSPQSGGILFGCGKSVTVRDNRVWNSYGFFTPFNTTASFLSASIYRNRVFVASGAAAGSQIQVGCDSPCNVTASPLVNGAPILLQSGYNNVPIGTKVTLSTSGQLPSPLVPGAIYYVASRPTPGSTCTLSTSVAGPSINWDGTTYGNGTIQMTLHATVPSWITDNIVQDERASPLVIQINSADQMAVGSIIDRNQYWKTSATSLTKFFFDTKSQIAFSQWQLLAASKCYDPTGSVSKPSWVTPPSKWSDFGA